MVTPNEYMNLNTYEFDGNWFYNCRFCSPPICNFGEGGLTTEQYPFIDGSKYISEKIDYIELKCGKCEKLYGAIEDPPVNYLMSFGSYKGKRLAKIPVKYLNWLVNNNIIQDMDCKNEIIKFLASKY